MRDIALIVANDLINDQHLLDYCSDAEVNILKLNPEFVIYSDCRQVVQNRLLKRLCIFDKKVKDYLYLL